MLEDIWAELSLDGHLVHAFASDIDAKTRAIIDTNFSPDHIYRDVRKRALHSSSERSADEELPAASEYTGALDLYIAGFPCQAWSTAGLRRGMRDPRGVIWVSIFKFISVALPKVVILENVSSLLHRPNLPTFEVMMALLESMDMYQWQHKVLNTQHFGVPQNRARVYIVGILKNCVRTPFVWPEPTPPDSRQSLNAFLDHQVGTVDLTRLPTAGSQARRKVVEALTKMIASGKNPLRGAAVCACDCRNPCVMYNVTPCLTASRCKTGGHWLMHRARRMTLKEMFRLQGLRPERWSLPPGVNQAHLQFCVGNAMSGNVVRPIIERVLVSLGRF